MFLIRQCQKNIVRFNHRLCKQDKTIVWVDRIQPVVECFVKIPRCTCFCLGKKHGLNSINGWTRCRFTIVCKLKLYFDSTQGWICGQYGKHCSVTAKHDAGSITGCISGIIPLFLVGRIQPQVEHFVKIPQCAHVFVQAKRTGRIQPWVVWVEQFYCLLLVSFNLWLNILLKFRNTHMFLFIRKNIG